MDLQNSIRLVDQVFSVLNRTSILFLDHESLQYICKGLWYTFVTIYAQMNTNSLFNAYPIM